MATEEFNPYHEWLGISPNDQPPNHYRLLGLEPLESDLKLIEHAAQQRISHLRTFQGGPNAAFSQALINQVAHARSCLLNPDFKATYDESLGVPKTEIPDSLVAPPVQIQSQSHTERYLPRRSGFPWATILMLLILCGGLSIAIWYYSNPVPPTDRLAQTENKSANKESTDQSPKARESSESAAEKEPGQVNDSVGKLSKPAEEVSKSGKKENKTPAPNDPDAMSTKDTSGNPESSKDKSGDATRPNDSKPTTSSDPDKSDAPPLIIGTKSTKVKKKVTREPVPPVDRWKPFTVPLKTEFNITENMTRDASFGLFNDLIQNASEESRADRAYAMFHLALDVAKSLHHSGGAVRYGNAFSKRFDFDREQARGNYLTALLAAADSETYLAKILVESQKRIRQAEQKQNYQQAVDLLTAIMQLTRKSIGKNIDRTHFEMWLKADELLEQVDSSSTQLIELQKQNQLTPEQHRSLGTLECFVAGNWKKGLQHYVQCDSKPIAEVAKKALNADVANTQSIADIADQWWVLSSKVTAERHLFKLRSKYWYDKYQKRTSAAEIPKKIEKRLKELTVGIGFNSLVSARSPSTVLLLDWETKIAAVTVAETSRLKFLGNELLGIVSKEDRLGADTTRFRIVSIKKQNQLLDDTANEFIDHTPVVVDDKVAWLKPKAGLTALDWKALSIKGQTGNPNLRRFQAPQPIRAFDVGDKGDVFALADKFIYWWNPQQAWSTQPNGQIKPTQFDSLVPFIANQIHVIPNSPTLALSDSRTLVRVNLASKKISELHTGTGINDLDFSASGNALVIALKNGIRYKLLKGGKNLFVPTSESTQVRFVPSSKFLVSLHKDHSIRIWDPSEKQQNYLVERYDSPDFLPTHFSISPDGKLLAAVDGSSQIRLFHLFYN